MTKRRSALRLAVAALTQNIYAGHVNKAGNTFLDGKQDVSSDFYKAVIDRFEKDGPHSIHCSDGTEYEVIVRLKPKEKDDGSTSNGAL